MMHRQVDEAIPLIRPEEMSPIVIGTDWLTLPNGNLELVHIVSPGYLLHEAITHNEWGVAEQVSKLYLTPDSEKGAFTTHITTLHTPAMTLVQPYSSFALVSSYPDLVELILGQLDLLASRKA